MRSAFLACRATPRVTNDVKWRSTQSASGARPVKGSIGIDRLEDSHAATVRHGTTVAPGDREQFDLQWKYTTSATHNDGWTSSSGKARSGRVSMRRLARHEYTPVIVHCEGRIPSCREGPKA
jgi:hypothetical protein